MIEVLAAVGVAAGIVMILYGVVAAVGTLLAKIDEIHDTRDK